MKTETDTLINDLRQQKLAPLPSAPSCAAYA